MSREMVNKQRVRVKLYGDEEWYEGTVIKARKQWVDIDDSEYPPHGMVADEHCIEEWEPVTTGESE